MQANRQSLRQQRRAITASERVQSARQILHQIQKISNTQNGQNILDYFNVKLKIIFDTKQIYTPIIYHSRKIPGVSIPYIANVVVDNKIVE
jgi:5-formyltetrahydrofolate cyclo-ligase